MINNFLDRRCLTNKHLRLALFTHNKGRCSNCLCELKSDWEADHIIPWRICPTSNPHEMTALCKKCNRSKGGYYEE